MRPLRRPDPYLAPSRTFARVLGFDLACPNCGAVDCVRTSSGVPWWKGTRQFHPWRSRWRCRACRRIYAVGLALWPVRRAGNFTQLGGTPVDTRPNVQQAMELRTLYGHVQRKTRGWYEEINLVCDCEAGPDGVHATDCPLAHDAPDETE